MGFFKNTDNTATTKKDNTNEDNNVLEFKQRTKGYKEPGTLNVFDESEPNEEEDIEQNAETTQLHSIILFIQKNNIYIVGALVTIISVFFMKSIGGFNVVKGLGAMFIVYFIFFKRVFVKKNSNSEE